MSGSTYGQAGLAAFNSDFNAQFFLIRQLLARVNTATLVQVQAVSNSGGVSPAGTVDVLPLISQVDGQGNAQPHVTLYGLPYLRIQGGVNAIILDPQVGDLGVAVFCSRDISAVKSSKAQANPGSRRKFSMSDGIFFGLVLGGTPTNYVQFSNSGINIFSTGPITFQGTNAKLDAAGNLSVNGDVVGGSISLQKHTHPDPQGGETGLPIG